jgi:hypothetical protein
LSTQVFLAALDQPLGTARVDVPKTSAFRRLAVGDVNAQIELLVCPLERSLEQIVVVRGQDERIRAQEASLRERARQRR